MIRKALVTTAAAVAIVATASPASARPVPDTPIECGPGAYLRGADCIPIEPLHEGGTIGEWALGVLGAAALVLLW